MTNCAGSLPGGGGGSQMSSPDEMQSQSGKYPAADAADDDIVVVDEETAVREPGRGPWVPGGDSSSAPVTDTQPDWAEPTAGGEPGSMPPAAAGESGGASARAAGGPGSMPARAVGETGGASSMAAGRPGSTPARPTWDPGTDRCPRRAHPRRRVAMRPRWGAVVPGPRRHQRGMVKVRGHRRQAVSLRCRPGRQEPPGLPRKVTGAGARSRRCSWTIRATRCSGRRT